MEKLNQILDIIENNARSHVIAGEKWYVSKDVCNCFGKTGYSNIMSQINHQDRIKTSIVSEGKRKELSFVSSRGLYGMLLAIDTNTTSYNNKQLDLDTINRIMELKKFQRWVFHDLLPNMRKAGFFNIEDLIGSKSK